MSKQETKTGLMYSPLSGGVFWGTMNAKTGVARSGAKDVTSDFIGVMLQKFQINTVQNIENNGKTEAVMIVLDEASSKKCILAGDMYTMLKSLVPMIQRTQNEATYKAITELLEKARG